MTLEECYAQMGADYVDALIRLYKPGMLLHFVRQFPADPSFPTLKSALEQGNVGEAFRAAHTLKGVCLNLGFHNIVPAAAALTETLRTGTLEGTAAQFARVEKEYNRTLDAIRGLDA